MTGLSGTGRDAYDVYLMAHHEISGKPRAGDQGAAR